MTVTTVEMFLDPVSPYAWLAMERIDEVIRAGGRIVCRPILFAALLNANATKGPAEVPVKRAYVFRDVMRQAKRMDLPFRGPPSHPFNPLAALRILHAVEDEAQRLVLARRLLAAAWRDGVDISDQHNLRSLLVADGLDADSLCAAAASPEIKARLRSATAAAMEAGIFGVPTFRVGNELFWGSDRVDALVWALQGGAIDDGLYRDVLARPASATR